MNSKDPDRIARQSYFSSDMEWFYGFPRIYFILFLLEIQDLPQVLGPWHLIRVYTQSVVFRHRNNNNRKFKFYAKGW